MGAGNIVNQVEFAYNDFGQLTHDYQSHAGAVDDMTTPKVLYLYANGADNTTRPTAIVYPNGRVVAYGYGEPDGLDDAASRIKTITDGETEPASSSSSSSSSTEQQVLVEYVYLGSGTFIEVDYTEPQIKYTLIGTEGGDDPDTGDIYRGLDRFGRIKDNYWYNYNSSTDVDRIKYGYDRNGNRTHRQNVVAESEGRHFDEKYLYDALDRLKSLDRGTLNELKSAITDSTFGQCWTLDETGNWHGFRQDDDGDGNWNLIQQRLANKVNEITEIENTTGPAWVTPAYDAAGNMTTIPQPSDPSQSYTATYDAWNRLVKIDDDTTSNTIAAYQYDGARRRIVQGNYIAGVLDETRHLYYTQPSQWQVIEERVNSSTTPDRQFIWGQRYIDDLILRDREEERLYALQDANWNVTAITGATGTVQERFAYSGYGCPVFSSASFDVKGASDFSWQNLFAAYRWDSTASYYDVRNRAYMPHLGWAQRDPIGLTRYDVNLYLYARNNPLNLTDPTGRAIPPPLAGCLAGGLIAGTVSGIVAWWTGGNIARTTICSGLGGCLGGAVVASAPSVLTACIAGVASQLVTSTCEEVWNRASGCEGGGLVLDGNFVCKLLTALALGCASAGFATDPRIANSKLLQEWMEYVVGAVFGLDLSALQSLCDGLDEFLD